MSDIIARIEQDLTFSIELEGLRGLVDFVCPFQVFGSSLVQFPLSGEDNLVQVVDLFESSHLSLGHGHCCGS